MILALLIWGVGLVTYGFVWVFMVLVRAYRNGYNLELYLDVMDAVSDEDDAEMKSKYSKFVYIVRIVFHNVLWPYKLIWLTKKFLPRFDERYADLVLEELEKGEHA